MLNMKDKLFMYLSIIFLVILVLLHIYYRRQSNVLDRLESKTYKYNLFTEKLKPKPELKTIDLELVLKEYNLLLKPIYIENVVKKYHYSKGNIDTQLKETSTDIIKEIFNVINTYSLNKFKFYDIENITEYKNNANNKLIQVQFLIHEVEKHFTRKLNLEYIIHNDNTLSVNALNFVSETNTIMSKPENKVLEIKKQNSKDYYDNIPRTISFSWNSTIHPFYYSYNKSLPAWIQISGQFKNDIETLHKVCYTQEPCKYDLDKWDTHGVNKQSKLKENCNIINHSDRILPMEPYINPTLFSIDS